uniref:Uncharacterized protein n=1 Tax=Bacillus phage Adastra TaxID=3143958 RepID=A0AAU8BDB4_9CAUD
MKRGLGYSTINLRSDFPWLEIKLSVLVNSPRILEV